MQIRLTFVTRALAVVSLAALGGLVGGCASSGAVPRPFPVPGSGGSIGSIGSGGFEGSGGSETSAGSEASSALDGYSLAGTALSLRGIPYRNGGVDPDGFDCSGFTQYVFAHHGVALPREVRDQFQVGKSVEPDRVSAGDLLFFATTSSSPSHVGIAIGGDEFVHAPSSTGVVRVEHVSSGYWSKRFIGARRIAIGNVGMSN